MTAKRYVLVLMVFFMLVGLSSCRKQSENDNDFEEVVVVDGSKDDIKPIREGIPSPLSGVYYPEEKVNRRPIAIIFDNHSKARPQAGLIEAEIVYEFLAEGDITRYLGIFLVGEPESIGGIRSARPYLIEKALEFDAMLVHVGGSPDAFADIDRHRVNNINALNRGGNVFWRKNHKPIPHNMYSSHDAIRKAAEASKFSNELNFQGWQFFDELTEIQGEKASRIEIFYSNPYQPSFVFDKEKGLYLRYYNGKPHIDETTSEELKATNIIIQVVNSIVVDRELRLKMDTIGTGVGKFISNGSVMEITWAKDDYRSITRYYDMEGNPLILNPGKTWVQIVRSLNSVKIFE